MKATNGSKGTVLAGRLGRADNPWLRLKGLLDRESLAADEGLLLKPCRGVHTFGMRCSIDLIFLGSTDTVIAVCHQVPPNRLPPLYPGTRSVLELPPGKIAETATEAGDLIVIEPGEGDQTKLRQR